MAATKHVHLDVSPTPVRSTTSMLHSSSASASGRIAGSIIISLDMEDIGVLVEELSLLVYIVSRVVLQREATLDGTAVSITAVGLGSRLLGLNK